MTNKLKARKRQKKWRRKANIYKQEIRQLQNGKRNGLSVSDKKHQKFKKSKKIKKHD